MPSTQRRGGAKQAETLGSQGDIEKQSSSAQKQNEAAGQSRSPMVKHLIAAKGEFVGTVLFLFFAEAGTSIANIPAANVVDASAVNIPAIIMSSLCFGTSLAVFSWIFFRVSGGLFNPAVSLALGLVGTLTPARVAILSITQLIGGIVASALAQALLPGPLYARTTLGGGTSPARGLFLEMFLTAMLILTILFLAVEKHKATFLAPLGIGLALFLGLLVGAYPTGASLNPARSFGPDLVMRQFSHYHYIYWIGPFLGSFLAAGIYMLFKYLHYETANPDQDATSEEEAEEDTEQADCKDKKIEEGREEDGSEGASDATSQPTRTGTPTKSGPLTDSSRGLERQLASLSKQNARLEKKLDQLLKGSKATATGEDFWALGGASGRRAKRD